MAKKELFNNEPYMIGWEETIKGDRWTFIKTGPAVCVIPFRKKTGNGLELLLIQEKRLGKTILKTVSCYLRGLEPTEGANKALLEEAGVTTQKLSVLCPEMVGFDVIRLPITLFLAHGWEVVQEGIAKNIVIGLEQAVEKVLNNEIGDQGAVDAILRIYVLHCCNCLP